MPAQSTPQIRHIPIRSVALLVSHNQNSSAQIFLHYLGDCDIYNFGRVFPAETGHVYAYKDVAE